MALSDNLIRFLGQNDDLPWFTDEGVQILFIEGHRKENWIQIAVAMDEHTTRTDHERAYSLAKRWRERLLDFQGPWLGGGFNRMFEQFYLCHQSGRQSGRHSYSELADRINSQLAQELERIVTEPRDCHDQVVEPAIALSWRSVIETMVAWGLSEEKATAYWQEGEANFNAGRPAWPNRGQPISRDHVRAQLRAWQKKYHDEEASDDVD